MVRKSKVLKRLRSRRTRYAELDERKMESRKSGTKQKKVQQVVKDLIRGK